MALDGWSRDVSEDIAHELRRPGDLQLRGSGKCAGFLGILRPGARSQAEPTIAKAINGGYDLLEAKCNRCDRVSLVPLPALKHRRKPRCGSWRPRSIASPAVKAGTTAAGDGRISSG